MDARGGCGGGRVGEMSRGRGDAVAEEMRDGRRWKMLEVTVRRRYLNLHQNLYGNKGILSEDHPRSSTLLSVTLTLQRRQATTRQAAS